MTEVASQRLEQKAAELAGQVTDALVGSTLTAFEKVLPGITEKVDLKAIKEALSTEVARSIKENIDTGTEESLTAALSTVQKLRTLLEGNTQSVSEEAEIRRIITDAGGIFIGKEELVKLGKLSADIEIPAMPEWISAKFLQSEHELRGGTIASHVIVGFDTESQKWLCIDRGNGGKSDIVPGSLGPDGCGLSGSKQDKLIRHISMEGAGLSSPDDNRPVKRILDNAIALHMSEGKSAESLPFAGIWGRTADTDRAAAGCRVLLGHSYEHGTHVRVHSHSGDANYYVGLLACWNQK